MCSVKVEDLKDSMDDGTKNSKCGFRKIVSDIAYLNQL
jgi:hypothetical protein